MGTSYNILMKLNKYILGGKGMLQARFITLVLYYLWSSILVFLQNCIESNASGFIK